MVFTVRSNDKGRKRSFSRVIAVLQADTREKLVMKQLLWDFRKKKIHFGRGLNQVFSTLGWRQQWGLLEFKWGHSKCLEIYERN